MTQVNRSALVLHSAEQMFDLVNDVRNYPAFLPGVRRPKWCLSPPRSWWRRCIWPRGG